MKKVFDIVIDIIKRFIRFIAGFILGWVIYMFAMFMTTFDGILSLIFQPFIGVLVSGIFVFAAFVVGLLLRIPILNHAWNRLGWRVLFITAASLLVMIFNAQIGLSGIEINPDTNEPIRTMLAVPAMVCYFMAVFPLVNFPEKAARYA